jgi:hypothetical protein
LPAFERHVDVHRLVPVVAGKAEPELPHLARNSGFSAAELRKAEKVVVENEEWLINARLTFWGEK